MEPLLRSPAASKRPCPFSARACADEPGPVAVGRLVEALLALPDPSVSLDFALERVLDATPIEPDKDRAVEAAMRSGFALVEAAKRAARKLASKHNSAIWPLPPDLTIKVFSMLDTRSVCNASAACLMFTKCASDPMCYANIDLRTNLLKINNTVVTTMIQRAGKMLRSLNLGVWPSPSSSSDLCRPTARNSIDVSGLSWNEKKSRQGKESSFLTRSCLLCLSADGGASGALLRSLHLSHIEKMDVSSLCAAVSLCPLLLDLELIGLHVELKDIIDSVSNNCNSLERLSIESSETGNDDSLKSATCADMVIGCPKLESLELRGFNLHDNKIRKLVKGFRFLKLLDFSKSYSVTGTFLRNLGNGTNSDLLEVLILRDCLHLKEVEIARFLSALLAGDCKHLRHLDISNKDGLSAENDWKDRIYAPRVPITQVLEARPDMCVLAYYPPEGGLVSRRCIGDASSTSYSSSTSTSSSTSLSESSYTSDTASGDDETSSAIFVGNSSDDDDFDVNW